MTDVGILKDIVIIFALSTFVNFIFTKLKVPTIIGYLVTGIIAGPKLLGVITSIHDIELMAEIGVVLLMFTIGMEFSLNHLLRIRNIVFFGGFIQLLATAAASMFLALGYDLAWGAAIFVGFLTALSSTAVVLKILQERSEITSNYGRTVVGILIFQDIILVPMLLFTPLLSGHGGGFEAGLISLIVKALGIIAFVFVGNKWVMPKVLHWIAMTRNQELFLMSILLICLSIAMLTYSLGMSLAFGAFLAGLMVSESEYSHNAFGNLIPFKDTFTSFFFVSIGMLLDLHFVLDNLGIVLITVVLVIFIKAFWAGFTAFILGHTFRGTVMVGVALSQVGEFSFILAKMGEGYHVITPFFYQLFLAVAVVTMSITPFMIMGAKPLANLLLKLPLPKKVVEGLFPLAEIDVPDLKNHLVLIGKDSRALNLSVMAKRMSLPYIAIVFDPGTVRKRQQKGETVIYGDAVNEPILQKAHVDTAEVVVISIGDLITSMAVVDKVRHMNHHAFIIVRTRQVEDIEELYRLGANQVIPEEFETSIDLFERILNKYLVPRRQIAAVIAGLRDHHYGVFRENSNENTFLHNDISSIEVSAIRIMPHSTVVNQTVAQTSLRYLYQITVVGIKRGSVIIDQIESSTLFKNDDIVYLLGKPENIEKVVDLFDPPTQD